MLYIENVLVMHILRPVFCAGQLPGHITGRADTGVGLRHVAAVLLAREA